MKTLITALTALTITATAATAAEDLRGKTLTCSLMTESTYALTDSGLNLVKKEQFEEGSIVESFVVPADAQDYENAVFFWETQNRLEGPVKTYNFDTRGMRSNNFEVQRVRGDRLDVAEASCTVS